MADSNSCALVIRLPKEKRVGVNNTRSCACKLKYLLLYKWFWNFFFFTFPKNWVGRAMASEVLNWDGLEVKRLKTGVFQLKDLPLIFEKSFLEIYIKFTCWWLFCCRSAKHFHIVLCVWICNSELRHGRILVTPCSFYVLLQCNGIARCFFWHQDACWVTKLYRKPELSRLLWLVQGAMWFRHGSTKTWNPECGIRKRNHGNVNGNGIRERRFQAIDLKKKT